MPWESQQLGLGQCRAIRGDFGELLPCSPPAAAHRYTAATGEQFFTFRLLKRTEWEKKTRTKCADTGFTFYGSFALVAPEALLSPSCTLSGVSVVYSGVSLCSYPQKAHLKFKCLKYSAK